MKYKKIIIAGALLATTTSCGKNNDDATTSASSEENNEQGTAGASKKADALKSDFGKKFKELERALASVVVKDEKLPVYDITDKFVKAKDGETNTKYSFKAAAEFFKSEDSEFAQDAITRIVNTASVTVRNSSKVNEMLCVYDKDKTSKKLTNTPYENTYVVHVKGQYNRLLLRTISGDTRNVNKLVAQIKTSNDKEALKQLGDSLTVEKLIPGTCKLTSKDLKMYPKDFLKKYMPVTMAQLSRQNEIEDPRKVSVTMDTVKTAVENHKTSSPGEVGSYVGDGGFGYVSSRNNTLPALVENAYKSYEGSFKYVIRLMKEAINAKIKMIDAKSTKAGSKQ